jgi:hypothetical protein
MQTILYQMLPLGTIWCRSIQLSPSQPVSLRSVLQLTPNILNGRFQ